jgi:hypothetical protein
MAKELSENIEENIILEKIFQAYSMKNGIVECAARTGLGKTYQTGKFSSNVQRYIKQALESEYFKNALEEKNVLDLTYLSNEETGKKTTIIYLAHQKLPCQEIIQIASNQNKDKDYYGEYARVISLPDLAYRVVDIHQDYKKNKDKYELIQSFFTANNKKELDELKIYRDKLKKSEEQEVKKLFSENLIKIFKNLRKELIIAFQKGLEKKYEEQLENNPNIYPDKEEYVKVKIKSKNEKSTKSVKIICQKEQIEWIKPFLVQSFWDSFSLISLTYDMLLERGISHIEGREKYLNLILDSPNKILIVADEVDSAPDILYNKLIERSGNILGSNDFFSLLTDLSYVLNHQDPYINDTSSQKDNFNKQMNNCKKQWVEYFSDIKFNVTLLATEKVKSQIAKTNSTVNFVFKDDLGLYSLSEERGNLYYIYFPNTDGPAYLINHSELEQFQADFKDGKFFEIKDFLRKASKTLNFFSTIVFNSGLNYIDHLEMSKNNKKSSEQNSRTLCDLYQISTELESVVQQLRDSWTSKMKDISESGFYEKGFELFHIEAPNDATPAKIKRYKLATTPEKIFLDLAKKHPILFLSATCNVPTIKNFDLNYLKENLNQRYVVWTQKDTLKAKQEDKLFSLPLNIQTEVVRDEDSYKDEDESIDDFLTNRIHRFAQEHSVELQLNRNTIHHFQNELTDCFKKYPSEKESANQYAVFLDAFIQFRKNNITSALFLFQRQLKKELCSLLATETIKHLDNKKEVIFFDATAEKLRKNDENNVIKEFSNSYQAGNDCYLISSFGTMNKSVNFKFNVRDNEKTELLTINNHALNEKSFQGIFVGTKKHYFTNNEKDPETGKPNQLINVSKIKQICEIYKCAAFNCITHKEARELTKDCIVENKSLHSLKKEKDPIKNLKAFSVFELISQSLGRLTRGYVYSKDMLIMTTDKNKIDLKTVYGTPSFKNFSITPILEALQTKITTSQEIITKETSENFIIELKNKSEKFKTLKNQFLNRVNALIAKNENINEYIDFFDNKLGSSLYLGPFIEKADFENYLNLHDNNETWTRALNFMYASTSGENLKNGIHYKENNDYQTVDISLESGSLPNFYSPEECNIQKFISLPYFIHFAKKHSVPIYFPIDETKEYKVLTPYAYNNTYKGRLGEFVGLYLFNQIGIDLERITDNSIFEFADYSMSTNPKFVIDFKNYSNPQTEMELILKKIYNKAKKMDITEYSVINVTPIYSKESPIQFMTEFELNGEMLEFKNKHDETITVSLIQATHYNDTKPILSKVFKEYFLDK